MSQGPLPIFLYVEEINVILGALSKLPYDQVNMLVTKIQTLATQQLEARQQPPEETLPPVDIH
jgi:hypothetical protein